VTFRQDGPVGELRLCTWNVRALRDDRTAVVRTLRRVRPDVVCLQECPRLLRWRTRLAALAREAGLQYVAGGRPAGRTAILASLRVDVREVREVLLSATAGLERRGATLARVRLPGSAEVGVAAVHLGLHDAERRRHLDEVEAAVAALGAPYAVVAGDLNERPDAAVWQALAARRRDCGTDDSRSTFPRRAGWRIDGVFADDGLDVLGYDVVDDSDARAGSDHLPVLVRLDVPDAIVGHGSRR
jgi:endonuclease/exonuclease/phosphatase family metal-dependent hydrolase